MGTPVTDQPKVLIACNTWHGGEYALQAWADAYFAQTYPRELLGAFMVDNSEDMPTGLHYSHVIRGKDIPCRWLTKLMPSFWDTLEIGWAGPGGIVEYAHEGGYDLIFSVEHDVVVAPEATGIMVAKSLEYAADGKLAIVSHEVQPRGQDGATDFHWDTLACTMLPVAPLHADRLLVKAMYETEVFITCKRHGHPRHRTKDLFAIDHMRHPDDPRAIGEGFAATPASDTYALRKITYNRAKDGAGSPAVESARQQIQELAAEKQVGSGLASKRIPLQAEPGHIVGGSPVAAPAAATVKTARPTVKMRSPLPAVTDDPPINLLGVKDEAELVKLVAEGGRIRLNLGCGYQQIAGFIGVDFDESLDPDIVSPVEDLSWCPDNACDMIFASHVLEHLDLETSRKALKEWLRVLKPAGFLDVAVPDINEIYMLYKKGSRWGDYQQLVDLVYVNATAFGANLLADAIPEMRDMYGGPGHEHKQIFIHDMLVQRLLGAGFVEVHEVTNNFLRQTSIGEVMAQGRKVWYPEGTEPMPLQPMLRKE
jgi:hypothetical protein